MRRSRWYLIQNLEDILLGLLMAAICGLVLAQVIWRYFLRSSISWSEELTRWLLVYMVMLGVSAAIRHGSHVSVTMLVARLPSTAQIACRVMIWLATLIVVVVVGYQGYEGARSQANLGAVSPGMLLPVWYATAAVPVGMAFALVRLIEIGVRGVGAIATGRRLPNEPDHLTAAVARENSP